MAKSRVRQLVAEYMAQVERPVAKPAPVRVNTAKLPPRPPVQPPSDTVKRKPNPPVNTKVTRPLIAPVRTVEEKLLNYISARVEPSPIDKLAVSALKGYLAWEANSGKPKPRYSRAMIVKELERRKQSVPSRRKRRRAV